MHHVFIEVSPDVFANNRLSSTLDTGKAVEDILAKCVPRSSSLPTLTLHRPLSKYEGAVAFGALLEHLSVFHSS
jgi:hypothetical protein